MVIVKLIHWLIKGIIHNNVRLLLTAAFFFLALGIIGSYLTEVPTNPSFQNGWDCFWWTLVTMSTVGYGDIVPITAAGRVIASICMIGGPLVMVTLVASVSASFYNKWTRGKRGMNQVKTKNHIVICTWNEKAEDIIAELRQCDGFQKRHITIVDAHTEEKPVDDPLVSFVRGNATSMQVLKQANIKEAEFAIVLAEDSTAEADQKTVLTVLAIESANPKIVTCAELNDNNNEEHLHRAGCDIVLNTPALTSKLLAMSLQNRSAIRIVKELMGSGAGNEIYRVRVPLKYSGQSFSYVMTELKNSHNAITIGIERNGECLINPSSDFLLKVDDQLLIISEHTPSLEDSAKRN